MLEIVHNKHMRWHHNRGVYLHFIYGVERFLEMLMGLKKSIKIIFLICMSTIHKILLYKDKNSHSKNIY
jgi:hypothetical protein